MEDQVKPSLLNRILTPTIFLLGGIAAVSWFTYRVFVLVEGFDQDVVVVEKGAYYALGVGLGMLDLAFVIIWEQWLLKALSKSATKIFSRAAIASIVLLIAVPHVIHFIADNRLKHQGYTVCEDASHQWLFIRDIVYIREAVECKKSLKSLHEY